MCREPKAADPATTFARPHIQHPDNTLRTARRIESALPKPHQYAISCLFNVLRWRYFDDVTPISLMNCHTKVRWLIAAPMHSDAFHRSNITTGLQANLLDDGIVDTLVAIGASTPEIVCSLGKAPGCGTCMTIPDSWSRGNFDLLPSCQHCL